MVEYLKNSVWLKIAAFSVIASVISIILSAITQTSVAAMLSAFFIVCSVISIGITVYLLLKQVYNFNRLISSFVFFVILSVMLKLCNVILGNDYLDIAWRYSLVIGGIAILIQIFLIIFGKEKINIFVKDDAKDNTEDSAEDTDISTDTVDD